ncbi:hypothetical protein HAX54_023004, partial [Datura stramonium]|nr:hypothetical protein [Datura stramonium]
DRQQLKKCCGVNQCKLMILGELLIRGTIAAVGFPLQRDRGDGRSPTVMDRKINRRIRRSDFLTTIASPLQRK